MILGSCRVRPASFPVLCVQGGAAPERFCFRGGTGPLFGISLRRSDSSSGFGCKRRQVQCLVSAGLWLVSCGSVSTYVHVYIYDIRICMKGV